VAIFSGKILTKCSQITARAAVFNEIDTMKATAKIMHKELLELIQTLPDTSTGSDGQSVCTESIFH
jgi:hypothetical protein